MTPGEAAIEAIAKFHGEEIKTALEILLNGIPPAGGKCTRSDLESLIRQAFIDGVLSERERPFGSTN